MQMTFDELMDLGEKIRETGDPKTALLSFNQAHIIAKEGPESVRVLCQIGLCQEHLGELSLALDTYRVAMDHARAANDAYGKAHIYRHMASNHLARGDKERAVKCVTLAYQILEKLDPEPLDAVWILHGLVKVFIAAEYPKAALKHWLELERAAWKRMLHYNVSSVNRRVWTIGYFWDEIRVYPLKALYLGPAAVGIALLSGLGLRLKQAWFKLLGRRYP